ncbi:MAG: DUF4430 domain-containing protein [Lachnospiraceae bacterium]
MNKKRRNIIIGLVVLVALVGAFLAIYFTMGPKANQGSKAYTLTVVDDESAEVTYKGKTDAEFLIGLMEELAEEEDFTFDGEDGVYGFTIFTVNGLEADFNKGSAYWAIYVNDEYGMYGAESQPVTDGDAYKLAYETY